MRKEALIAIIIGLTFGGLITYGVYTANRNSTPTSTPTPTPAPTPITNSEVFQLNNLEDGDIFTTPSATISGMISEGYYLTISSDTDDYVVSRSSNGSFSQSVKLTTGDNPIRLTALNFEGNKQEKTIHLIFTTNPIPTP